MSCLCGDPCCPSCGPAQGYCPKCSERGLDECVCHDEVDDFEFELQREDWIAERDEARGDAGDIFDD